MNYQQFVKNMKIKKQWIKENVRKDGSIAYTAHIRMRISWYKSAELVLCKLSTVPGIGLLAMMLPPGEVKYIFLPSGHKSTAPHEFKSLKEAESEMRKELGNYDTALKRVKDDMNNKKVMSTKEILIKS
jgi:hypothetical protein